MRSLPKARCRCRRPVRQRRWQVLPLSARTSTAIEQSCRRLSEHLAADPSLELGDVAYTLQLGRKVFGHRKFVVSDDLSKAITIFGEPNSPFSRVDGTVGRKVGFLIAGVGEQYPGMVAELYAEEPDFRATVDECLGLLGLTDVGQLSDIFAGSERADTGTNDLARLLGRQAPVEQAELSHRQPADPAGHLRRRVRTGQAADALGRAAGADGRLQPGRVRGGLPVRRAVAAGRAAVGGLPGRADRRLPEGAMLAVAGTEPQLREVLGAELAGLDIAIGPARSWCWPARSRLVDAPRPDAAGRRGQLPAAADHARLPLPDAGSDRRPADRLDHRQHQPEPAADPLSSAT